MKMKMKNIDLRNELAQSGIMLWQIAHELGISDGNLSRKLRRELDSEEKTQIRDLIKKIILEED